MYMNIFACNSDTIQDTFTVSGILCVKCRCCNICSTLRLTYLGAMTNYILTTLALTRKVASLIYLCTSQSVFERGSRFHWWVNVKKTFIECFGVNNKVIKCQMYAVVNSFFWRQYRVDSLLSVESGLGFSQNFDRERPLAHVATSSRRNRVCVFTFLCF